MKNLPDIQTFSNEDFGKIHRLLIDGIPYFVGKDIADALGYRNASKAVMDHVDDEDKLKMNLTADSQNGNVVTKTTLINESGMYSLIMSSKLPTAKKFKCWVTNEVLPSIRKTGKYELNPAPVEKLSTEKLKLLLEAAKISPNDEIKIEILRKIV